MALKVIHHRTCQAAATEVGRQIARSIGVHKRPLLLLSGGSSLNAITVLVSRLSASQKKRLVIMQIDERLVPFNRKGSNWAMIRRKFGSQLHLDPKYAMYEKDKKPRELASNYSALLEHEMSQADITIGLYGMGADGHIAGMLPTRTPIGFMRFLDGRSVVTHKAKDYYRMTTTSEVIVKLDKIYGLVCGKEKYEAVKKLDTEAKMREQPAQLLKDAKNAELHVNVGR